LDQGKNKKVNTEGDESKGILSFMHCHGIYAMDNKMEFE